MMLILCLMKEIEFGQKSGRRGNDDDDALQRIECRSSVRRRCAVVCDHKQTSKHTNNTHTHTNIYIAKRPHAYVVAEFGTEREKGGGGYNVCVRNSI